MSVDDASAAALIVFAATSAATPNTFIASAITVAASPASILPTLANAIAASPAPPRTSSRLIPALSSSRKLDAAAAGPTLAFIAASFSLVSSSLVRPVEAAMSNMMSWKFAPTTRAPASGAAIAAPPAIIAPPIALALEPKDERAEPALLRAVERDLLKSSFRNNRTNAPPACTSDLLAISPPRFVHRSLPLYLFAGLTHCGRFWRREVTKLCPVPGA